MKNIDDCLPDVTYLLQCLEAGQAGRRRALHSWYSTKPFSQYIFTTTLDIGSPVEVLGSGICRLKR